jgi:hypothetical protein
MMRGLWQEPSMGVTTTTRWHSPMIGLMRFAEHRLRRAS